MGRIFSIQAKNVQHFRRKTKRKLQKGDVVRIHGDIPNQNVKEELDLRPQTKDILFSKNSKRTLKNDTDFTVLEIK